MIALPNDIDLNGLALLLVLSFLQGGEISDPDVAGTDTAQLATAVGTLARLLSLGLGLLHTEGGRNCGKTVETTVDFRNLLHGMFLLNSSSR